METIVKFLPTLLNQLFEIISMTTFEESALKIIRLLTVFQEKLAHNNFVFCRSIDFIISTLDKCEKQLLLFSYVKVRRLVFKTPPIFVIDWYCIGKLQYSYRAAENRTTFNVVIRSLKLFFSDQHSPERLMQHLWFFLELATKDMLQYLHERNLLTVITWSTFLHYLNESGFFNGRCQEMSGFPRTF